MDILADIFYLHRYLFKNLYKWFIAAIKFIMSIHYFACIWILIHEQKRIRGWDYIKFSDEDHVDPRLLYLDSFYLITSTISSVGYGHDNFMAYPDNRDSWLIEMCYMIFVIGFGMNLFSLITNEIFSYKSMLTVN